jgi:hypothetical protein
MRRVRSCEGLRDIVRAHLPSNINGPSGGPPNARRNAVTVPMRHPRDAPNAFETNEFVNNETDNRLQIYSRENNFQNTFDVDRTASRIVSRAEPAKGSNRQTPIRNEESRPPIWRGPSNNPSQVPFPENPIVDQSAPTPPADFEPSSSQPNGCSAGDQEGSRASRGSRGERE